VRGIILTILILGLFGVPDFFSKSYANAVGDSRGNYVFQDYVNSEVNKYIEEVLTLNPRDFNISLQVENDILHNSRVFENFESEVLVQMMHGFLRESYGNVLEVGEAGSGKTTDLRKLALFFSYGAVPPDVREKLQMDNPMLKQFYGSRIGKTQVIDVSIDLINRDNTLPGKAFASQDERMKQIIKELFSRARDDFHKTGLRTLFVFDEVGTYPDLVQQTLKKPLDKTGYKNIADEFESTQDTGISALAITTYSEIQQLIKADTAVQRRYFIIYRKNMSDEKAFSILADKANRLKGKFGELEVSEDALRYLVKMNEFFNSPPQVAPGSTNNALDDLVNWFIFNRSKNGAIKKVTLLDAQAWFARRIGFSDDWLPGPNGEPPLRNLADQLKEELKGQDRVAEQMARPIEAFVRLGTLPPIILLMGGTAVGKNTVIRALNKVLFRNPNDNFRYSIGGDSGYSFRELFQGSESRGSNPGAMPLVVDALESGSGLGVLNLDEGADAPSRFYSELKVLVEKRKVEPVGRDRRVRNWFLPIVISGQWGEHLTEGYHTDEEIQKRYLSMTQKELDDALLYPPNADPGYGAVPRAFIQRVKKAGAIIFMPPTPKANYPAIVHDIYVKEFVNEMKGRII